MLVVEIGMQLNKPYIYYENILKEHGLECVFECTTHDVYFSNNDFVNIDKMTEREIKESCIRVRQINGGDYEIQNNLIENFNKKRIKASKFDKLVKDFNKRGYKKIFDTIKFDHHWFKEGMNTKIQMQETKDVGLLVFLDNKEYYGMDVLEQRKKLIDELNSYGFKFSYDDLGLDKLRTLYYREEKYSLNQNA